MGYLDQIHKKGKWEKLFSKRDQKINAKKSRVRARVEYIFGSITDEQGGGHFKIIGFARNELKIGMMNVVYNMRYLVTLHRINPCSN